MATNSNLSQSYGETPRRQEATPGRHGNLDPMDGDAYNRIVGARADAFQRDEGMEALISRIDKDPAVSETLTPQLRISLGYYEDARSAHADLND